MKFGTVRRPETGRQGKQTIFCVLANTVECKIIKFSCVTLLISIQNKMININRHECLIIRISSKLQYFLISYRLPRLQFHDFNKAPTAPILQTPE